jgi:DNA processing protein
MDTNLRHLIRLSLTRRIAARGRRRLLETFGSLERAFAAPESALAAVPAIGPETARALKVTTDAAVDQEIRRAAAIGTHIVGFGCPGYPARLAQLADPPLVLYVRGTLPEDEPGVALVGARRASQYGLRVAADLAKGLAEVGVAVISGLARGVDAAAHRGAIAAGGRTIAVLGSGIDRPYPPEHDGLVEDIVRSGGAVVTELPLDAPPLGFHFPRRNRIVSGLSLGVVVVEAAEKSGSLITAEWALEQGKDVMAVPGRVGDAGSTGCHRLIKEGAALVEDAIDILAALDLAPAKSPKERGGSGVETKPQGLSPHEERVYSALTKDPLHIDDLIETTCLPASTVFATLTTLELRRAVKSWPGKMYQKL